MLGENTRNKRGEREEEEEREVQKNKEREEEGKNANWIPEWEWNFSEEEVKEATKKIKRNKAPGEDKIIIEFFRELPIESQGMDKHIE